MTKKTWGIILLVAGIAVLVVSLVADLIGLGGSPGFGYKQLSAAVVGMIAAVVGYILAYRK
jgi:hypothetical protein